ncbi:hypothetical protein BcabD6B2_58720 (apicoplast) [Babesia caballi]|uniref:Ribosomal protein L4 n=1 Tax=Babesia caballi TaxID=5871 RepID=A0AAV4M3K0_BABCB|nr:hypothetical protein BcabD6B2_58720 [Babesia caballi]
MNTLLLNINSYFNLYYIQYIFNILIYKLGNNSLNYKYILLYIKNLLKKTKANLKNKYNSTKSRNKRSKTYHYSSHIARKGSVWFGLRRLKLKNYKNSYNKLLLSILFNLRSNLTIHSLEYIKFLYYIKNLNSSYFKLILNSDKYINYIQSSNNNLLYKLNKCINILY